MKSPYKGGIQPKRYNNGRNFIVTGSQHRFKSFSPPPQNNVYPVAHRMIIAIIICGFNNDLLNTVNNKTKVARVMCLVSNKDFQTCYDKSYEDVFTNKKSFQYKTVPQGQLYLISMMHDHTYAFICLFQDKCFASIKPTSFLFLSDLM